MAEQQIKIAISTQNTSGNNSKMNKIKKTIFSLLLVSILFTACNRQVEIKQPSESSVGPFSFTNKHPKLKKTLRTDEFQVIACSIKDRKDNLWFGTSGEGVYQYDGKIFTQFTKKDGLCDDHISMIFEDNVGCIWFGSKSAISRFDGKKFTTISIPQSSDNFFPVINIAPEKNELWSMFQDKSGIVWLGTTDGIYCYNGISFTRFLDTNSNVVNNNNVHLKWTQGIFEDKSGNIWFGSWVLANEGICRYDGKSITQYKPYGEGWVRGVLEDKNGDILIVTRHNGICRLDGVNFTNITQKGGIENGSVNVAFKDRKGNIWIGTELGSGELNEDGGLWRYDGMSFTRFIKSDGLCHNGVFSILQDAIGNLWIGSRNTDLCRFDGQTFTPFSE